VSTILIVIFLSSVLPNAGRANRVSQSLYCYLPDGAVTEINTIVGPYTCQDFGAQGDGLRPEWWDKHGDCCYQRRTK
jgi:hypothetical protein